jgi:hypothetical protein
LAEAHRRGFTSKSKNDKNARARPPKKLPAADCAVGSPLCMPESVREYLSTAIKRLAKTVGEE